MGGRREEGGRGGGRGKEGGEGGCRREGGKWEGGRREGEGESEGEGEGGGRRKGGRGVNEYAESVQPQASNTISCMLLICLRQLVSVKVSWGLCPHSRGSHRDSSAKQNQQQKSRPFTAQQSGNGAHQGAT